MPSRISFAELGLIQAYRSTTGLVERRPIIHSYAEITAFGRAEGCAPGPLPWANLKMRWQYGGSGSTR